MHYDTIRHADGTQARVLDKLEEATSPDMLYFVVLSTEYESGDHPDDLEGIRRLLRTEVNKMRMGDMVFNRKNMNDSYCVYKMHVGRYGEKHLTVLISITG